MVDRDPVTEPAGDMVAAQVLIDVLSWLDTGDDEKFRSLSSTLLGWKGRRLRDAIADTGLIHLGRRQTNTNADTSDEQLKRLTRAAGLVFTGPLLESFVQDWVALAESDSTFQERLLTALGELIPILQKRHEKEIASVGLLLLEQRSALSQKDLPRDAQLAEYLYKHFARTHRDVAEGVRAWFCAHPSFEHPHKHRVLRSAALLGHWDVVMALFASGQPYGPPGTHKTRPPQMERIHNYLLDRLKQEPPGILGHLNMCVVDLVQDENSDQTALLHWLHTFVTQARADTSLLSSLRTHPLSSASLQTHEALEPLLQLQESLTP